jgi:perosamine synthetase
MDPVLRIAEKYNLRIIEDAAEMHGQTYHGKRCGSFGDISIFSFYPNKHITTGEGGMIVTDNTALSEKCRSLKNLCFKPERRFIHDDIGWNFRMTNLQAALGCAQLERIDEFILKKREMGRMYTDGLRQLTCLQLPLEKTSFAENIYWVYGILLKEAVPFNSDEAMRRLSEKGIGSRPFFWCMHEQPVFNKKGMFLSEKFSNAEMMARRGFYIPSGLALTKHQIDTVIEKMYEIFKEYC